MKLFTFLILMLPFILLGQEKGNAGVYSIDLHGRKTASGQKYNKNKFTASHKTLPFNTWIRVKRVDTGQTTEVKINDRGPYTGNRIIDLSSASAKQLGLTQGDITVIEIEVLGKDYVPSDPTEVIPIFKKRAKENKKVLEKKQEKKEYKPIKKAKIGSLKKNKPFVSNLLGVNLYNVPKSGFAIQMGIFSSFENIYLQISALPKSFQTNTLILPIKKKGKLIYKLLLGPYQKKSTARNDQVKMRKFVKDCIVVDLAGL